LDGYLKRSPAARGELRSSPAALIYTLVNQLIDSDIRLRLVANGFAT
jgi:hypothetical protein